jgi:DNA gyrase/topoisomerase IV subunit A
VLEGLLRAIELSGEVIDAVAHRANRHEVLRTLTGPLFGFSDRQAAHVLNLRALSVTDEYRAHLATELAALKAATPTDPVGKPQPSSD